MVEHNTDEKYAVSFTQMKDGSREEYLKLRELEQPFLKMTAKRLLRELRLQGEDSLPGYRITRLQHGLQAATRAKNDGADIDWIVGALLHDIGDGLAPQNHDRLSAEILRPFVREEVTWVVEHHGIFQMLYYAKHYNWDPNAREIYKSNPYYQSCADFCERWDQTSFDPDYSTLGLDEFTPLIEEVFSRSAYDAKVLDADVVKGLPAL